MSPVVGPVAVMARPGGGGAVDDRLASDSLRVKVDDEVRRIAQECYAEALDILRRHRANLDALADALLEHETLDEVEAYEAAGIERSPRGREAEAVV
jgi:cell division protease FtsH